MNCLSCAIETQSDEVTVGQSGLGFAWLAPLIQGAMSANQGGGQDAFTAQLALMAREREAEETRRMIFPTIMGVGILALGGTGLYLLLRKKTP